MPAAKEKVRAPASSGPSAPELLPTAAAVGSVPPEAELIPRRQRQPEGRAQDRTRIADGWCGRTCFCTEPLKFCAGSEQPHDWRAQQKEAAPPVPVATAGVQIQAKDKKPVPSDRVQNPHDPEATYAAKGQGEKKKGHVGYKVQVAETVCEAALAPGEPTRNSSWGS